MDANRVWLDIHKGQSKTCYQGCSCYLIWLWKLCPITLNPVLLLLKVHMQTPSLRVNVIKHNELKCVHVHIWIRLCYGRFSAKLVQHAVTACWVRQLELDWENQIIGVHNSTNANSLSRVSIWCSSCLTFLSASSARFSVSLSCCFRSPTWSLNVSSVAAAWVGKGKRQRRLPGPSTQKNHYCTCILQRPFSKHQT